MASGSAMYRIAVVTLLSIGIYAFGIGISKPQQCFGPGDGRLEW